MVMRNGHMVNRNPVLSGCSEVLVIQFDLEGKLQQRATLPNLSQYRQPRLLSLFMSKICLTN